MRELKFRVWAEENKQHFFEYFEIGENEDRYGRFARLASRFGSIIEQYTGLKDKNGKEIYEGDILLIPRTRTSSSAKMYQVIWYHTQARFKFVDICCEIENINIGKIKRSEVIGNIHENPELYED